MVFSSPSLLGSWDDTGTPSGPAVRSYLHPISSSSVLLMPVSPTLSPKVPLLWLRHLFLIFLHTLELDTGMGGGPIGCTFWH